MCLCGNPACINVGKHPHPVYAPNGLLNATVNAEEINKWPDDINIGLALNISNLIAIDIDAYKGDAERLSALEETLGELPETLMQLSGSGDGYHALYVAPDFPIKGSLGGITMRGRNYIVVSPSLHKSGKRYAWVNTAEVATLPDAWLDALRKDTTVDAAGIPDEEPAWLKGIGDDARYQACKEYVDRQDGETYQVSPPSLTWNVVRNAVRGYALRDADRAYTLLQTYNARCIPPWPDDKFAYKINKAYGEAVTPEWGGHLKPISVDLEEIGLTVITDDVPITADAVLLQEAYQDVKAALNVTIDNTVHLLFENAQGLFDREYPATVWLVNGLITAGGIAVIATEPKAAKTWAATEVALAVSTGTKAFGHYETTKGPVAYFYAEDIGQSIRNRLRALAKARGIDPRVAAENLHVEPRGSYIDLTKPTDIALIVASVRKIGTISLLVLDPLRDIHTGEENSADSMAPVMKHLKILSNILSCTVLFIHHSNKGNGDGKRNKRGGGRMRGSNVIWGSLDSALYFDGLSGNGENQFTNTVESQVKGAKSSGYFNLTLDIIDGLDGTAIDARWSVTKDVTSIKTVDTLEMKINEIIDTLGVNMKPLGTNDLVTRCKGSKTTVVAATLEAEKRGLITHPPGRAHGYVLTEAGKRFFAGQEAPEAPAGKSIASAFLK